VNKIRSNSGSSATVIQSPSLYPSQQFIGSYKPIQYSNIENPSTYSQYHSTSSTHSQNTNKVLDNHEFEFVKKEKAVVESVLRSCPANIKNVDSLILFNTQEKKVKKLELPKEENDEPSLFVSGVLPEVAKTSYTYVPKFKDLDARKSFPETLPGIKNVAINVTKQIQFDNEINIAPTAILDLDLPEINFDSHPTTTSTNSNPSVSVVQSEPLSQAPNPTVSVKQPEPLSQVPNPISSVTQPVLKSQVPNPIVNATQPVLVSQPPNPVIACPNTAISPQPPKPVITPTPPNPINVPQPPMVSSDGLVNSEYTKKIPIPPPLPPPQRSNNPRSLTIVRVERRPPAPANEGQDIFKAMQEAMVRRREALKEDDITTGVDDQDWPDE